MQTARASSSETPGKPTTPEVREIGAGQIFMSTCSSNPRPLITVIIPTFNRAELLRRALDSVYAQEGNGQLFDLEVLVVDDGSTDRTIEVVRACPLIKYICPPANKGTSAARNVGLDAATGQYVAFLDDDDSWLPWKLRRQVQTLEEHPELVAVYGQEIKNSDRAIWVWPEPRDAPSGSIYRSLLTSCPVNTSSVMVRRTAIERVGRFDENLRCWEDYDMWLRVALEGPFRFLAGPAVIYQVAASGRFLSSVVTGESERDLQHVVRAEVWRKVAVSLAECPQSQIGLARLAAARSLAQHPATFGRALLRILINPMPAPH